MTKINFFKCILTKALLTLPQLSICWVGFSDHPDLSCSCVSWRNSSKLLSTPIFSTKSAVFKNLLMQINQLKQITHSLPHFFCKWWSPLNQNLV